MIKKVSKHILLGALSSFFLVGFTGQEKYVELENFLNGRTSAQFRASDANVKALLTTGTRAEILEFKKMASGNYGLRIRPINGSQLGQDLWVYYNVKQPDLKLYADAPAAWGPDANLRNPPTAAIEKAKGAETVRPVAALGAASETEKVDASPKTYPPVVLDTLGKISNVNAEIHRAGTAPTAAEISCPACKPKAIATPALQIRRPTTRTMEAKCSRLMSSSGQIGPWGESVISIMSEPRYARAYTQDNAMGSLCPRFNELSQQQRLQAWTWLWTALAQEESSCTLDLVHPMTARNRQGKVIVLNPCEDYGLWAMEKDPNTRRGRGSACNDISTAAGQARCTIDIMYKTQLSRGKSAANDPNSYWGPIRRKERQLMPHMRRLSLCF